MLDKIKVLFQNSLSIENYEGLKKIINWRLFNKLMRTFI